MAQELSLETLPEMKVAEFVKAFKDKAAWKKASAVILLMDYKLDGKKLTVAMPFRKATDAVKAFKKIKSDKIHLLKKVGLGSFNLEKVGDKVQANIEISKGGLSAEAVFTKAAKLFERIKLGLNFIGMAGAPEASEEEDEDEETVDNALVDDTTEDDTEEEDDMDDETSDTVSDSPEATAESSISELAPQEQAAALKTQYEQIAADLNVFKTQVVPNVQARNVAAADLTITSNLDQAISSFAKDVEVAHARVQEKFKPVLDKLVQYQAKLKQILDRFGNQETETTSTTETSSTTGATETTSPTGTRTVEETQQRLNEIKDRIAEIRSTHFS